MGQLQCRSRPASNWLCAGSGLLRDSQDFYTWSKSYIPLLAQSASRDLTNLHSQQSGERKNSCWLPGIIPQFSLTVGHLSGCGKCLHLAFYAISVYFFGLWTNVCLCSNVLLMHGSDLSFSPGIWLINHVHSHYVATGAMLWRLQFFFFLFVSIVAPASGQPIGAYVMAGPLSNVLWLIRYGVLSLSGRIGDRNTAS